jgi:hypothetical protein
MQDRNTCKWSKLTAKPVHTVAKLHVCPPFRFPGVRFHTRSATVGASSIGIKSSWAHYVKKG